MQGHIEVGREYPGVDNHTTYSFGLDDQEFVVAFDTDDVGTFLDLVQRLRTTEASRYTVRDTPSFTCIAMSLERALNALDGEPIGCRAAAFAGGLKTGCPRASRTCAAPIRCSPMLIAAVGTAARRARRAGPTARITTARSCARSSASSSRCKAARAIYGRLTDRFDGRPPTPAGDPRRRPRRAARRRRTLAREGRLPALAGRARRSPASWSSSGWTSWTTSR